MPLRSVNLRKTRHESGPPARVSFPWAFTAQHYLKENMVDDIVAKVQSGEPLTQDDMAYLQRVLVADDVDELFEIVKLLRNTADV